jgi:hypothetical protein
MSSALSPRDFGRRGRAFVSLSLRPLGIVIAMWVLASCSVNSRVESINWTLLSSSPDSATVRVGVVRGKCSSVLDPVVHEDGKSVTIEVSVRTRGDDCSAVGILQEVEVTLKQPLGDRTVLGASYGTWPGSTSTAAPGVQGR